MFISSPSLDSAELIETKTFCVGWAAIVLDLPIFLLAEFYPAKVIDVKASCAGWAAIARHWTSFISLYPQVDSCPTKLIEVKTI